MKWAKNPHVNKWTFASLTAILARGPRHGPQLRVLSRGGWRTCQGANICERRGRGSRERGNDHSHYSLLRSTMMMIIHGCVHEGGRRVPCSTPPPPPTQVTWATLVWGREGGHGTNGLRCNTRHGGGGGGGGGGEYGVLRSVRVQKWGWTFQWITCDLK